MYIGTKEVKEIKGNTVIFADGSERFMPHVQEYLTSDEPLTEKDGIPVESQLETRLQMFMLKKFMEAIQSLDEPIQSFAGSNEERDDYNVKVTTKLIKVMVDYDFPISRIDKVFHALKSWMQGLNTLMNNNLLKYERMSLVKSLGVENEGDSDDERLNNVKPSHYFKFLELNSKEAS